MKNNKLPIRKGDLFLPKLNAPRSELSRTLTPDDLFRRMFPLIMNDNSKSDGKNYHNNKKESELIHYYSSFSKNKPMNIKEATKTIPAANVSGLNFSGFIICPRTTSVKVTLAKSYRTFARLLHLFSVNSILNFRTNWKLCQPAPADFQLHTGRPTRNFGRVFPIRSMLRSELTLLKLEFGE
ncbi:hypothetical protein FP828_02345 [bacterium]|nr:hypothetical protein [bacterium]